MLSLSKGIFIFISPAMLKFMLAYSLLHFICCNLFATTSVLCMLFQLIFYALSSFTLFNFNTLSLFFTLIVFVCQIAPLRYDAITISLLVFALVLLFII